MSLQTERRFIEQEDQQPCALLNTPCNRLFSKLQDSNHKNQQMISATILTSFIYLQFYLYIHIHPHKIPSTHIYPFPFSVVVTCIKMTRIENILLNPLNLNKFKTQKTQVVNSVGECRVCSGYVCTYGRNLCQAPSPQTRYPISCLVH